MCKATSAAMMALMEPIQLSKHLGNLELGFRESVRKRMGTHFPGQEQSHVEEHPDYASSPSLG